MKSGMTERGRKEEERKREEERRGNLKVNRMVGFIKIGRTDDPLGYLLLLCVLIFTIDTPPGRSI